MSRKRTVRNNRNRLLIFSVTQGAEFSMFIGATMSMPFDAGVSGKWPHKLKGQKSYLTVSTFLFSVQVWKSP